MVTEDYNSTLTRVTQGMKITIAIYIILKNWEYLVKIYPTYVKNKLLILNLVVGAKCSCKTLSPMNCETR